MGIQVQSVTKKYPNTLALNNVSMNFETNKITGLIGFNGSGKTTSFNIISTLIEKYQGKVLLDGKPLTQEDMKLFSYISAGSEPRNSEKIINHLYYIGAQYGLKRKETLEIVHKMEKVLEFKGDIKKPIKSLSKGNQQKIKFMAAMLNKNMKYLLLDEPFDGLDPIIIKKIQNFLMDELHGKVTMIITSHRMDVVDRLCDSFIILKDGIVAEATDVAKQQSVIISTNVEMKVAAIKKIAGVKNVTKEGNQVRIEIDGIKKFKSVNKKLIDMKEYVWSSLENKSLADSVFERYA